MRALLMAGTPGGMAAALGQLAAAGPSVGESVLAGVLVLSGTVVLAVNRFRHRSARRR